MIILKNIYKDYKLGNTKVRALKDINLEFGENEFVCVHGPSGCGKTTLLNIIGGLDKYTSGKLIINNQDTSNFKDNDWDSYRNQEIGFVFQSYYLLPQLNVFENVEIALELINLDKDIREKMVNNALMSVGLLDQAKKMPNQLSGGQIQRVAIARAIVNEPSVILADEPTGALDSKNAAIIMDILKEIAKEKLVILVSHNIDLAKTYANRTIEMLDGEVIEDTKELKNEEKEKVYVKKKTSMGLFTSMKISIRNLLRTRLRTPLIVFAGSIGMIGIGLVLSIAKGVNLYIDDVQKQALVSYPVDINATSKVLDDEGNVEEPLVKFPDTDEVYVQRGGTKYDYYRTFNSDFVDYVSKLDNQYYSLIKYNRTITLNLLSYNVNTGAYKTQSSYFYEMTEDLEFMNEQYDLLYGDFPTNHNELVLLINDDNSLSASLLDSLNIDNTKEKIKFSKILETEYKIIDNNVLYRKELDGRYVRNNYSIEMFNNSEFSLKITGIIRAKKNASANIYRSQTGILYTKELLDIILENNLNSDIVKDQLENGLDNDVFTNQPFEKYIGDSYTMSEIYQYEENLYRIGAIPRIYSINIFTEKFHNRLFIKDYIESYPNKDESNVEIIYSDFMDRVTNEFTELVRVFSTVLIIFSSVSLIVSSIMIGIITYVSILQRTKEIGLLRSIGARKKDIARLFNVETMIIGLASGVLGIIGVLILLDPVNNFVKNMVSEYTYSFRGVESVIIARFELVYMLILLFGSMILSLISGFIPAVMASRKSPIDALRNER